MWTVFLGRPDTLTAIELPTARSCDLHNKLDYVFYDAENMKVASFPRTQIVYAIKTD